MHTKLVLPTTKCLYIWIDNSFHWFLFSLYYFYWCCCRAFALRCFFFSFFYFVICLHFLFYLLFSFRVSPHFVYEVCWKVSSAYSLCCDFFRLWLRVTINTTPPRMVPLSMISNIQTDIHKIVVIVRYLICISFLPFSCIWYQFCGQFSVYFFYICFSSLFRLFTIFLVFVSLYCCRDLKNKKKMIRFHAQWGILAWS